MDDKGLYAGLMRLHILHHAAEKVVCGVWVMEELRRHVATLRGRGNEVAELEGRLGRDRRETSLLEAQVRNHESRLSYYDAALQREAEIRPM